MSKVAFCVCVVVAVILCVACSASTEQPVIIWTNQQEFVSYAELFNASQNHTRVVVVYKEKPVESIPAAKDEQPPDIVIGPWLKNETLRKNFRPVDYLFSEQRINPAIFYPQFLNAGNVNDRQYLLPVSFNLPAVIFSVQNQSRVVENYIINTDQIRDTAAAYNRKNKSNLYTQMGFAPGWDSRFLYLVAKIKGSNFAEQGSLFTWNPLCLDAAVKYLREWTTDVNTSTVSEQDFAFKYLYTPGYKQVTAGKCLFSYITSDELFSISDDQLHELDFRWIHAGHQIPVEDDMIFMGLYKKARNSNGAESFINWFMREDTQRALLERVESMDLSVGTFGISGGFSAIRNVSERVFPLYYQKLLGNLPAADYLVPPNALPPRWESLRTRVVIPWLEEATDTKNETPPRTMQNLIDDWSKQFN